MSRTETMLTETVRGLAVEMMQAAHKLTAANITQADRLAILRDIRRIGIHLDVNAELIEALE